MFDNAGADNIKKKGCHWLYVTHDQACFEEIKRSLLSSQGAAVFKFEPMIMHIQVHTLSDAQKLHTTAVASGFRNSGISIGGKGKIIVAVRSTHSLEVPLSFGGQVLVSDDYIKHLVECGNKKMQENMSRIQKFFEHLQAMVEKIKSELCDEQKKTRIKQEPLSRRNGAGNLQQTSVVPSRSSESELLAMKSNDLASLEDDFSEWLFTET
ncbi:tRNA wybutosine-synthesizing protein 3 homolog [Pomacea canaliculata]|uniref:tRNA wybutosine-synthesizing protein 3 homolog n=1 Tax=Pomacea canaliculata TaxID=400727 RepID=UPI000D73CDFF|nr:tRNA wybutosine-synthesizing protein 3 homolog [Pomacea canaliculata]